MFFLLRPNPVPAVSKAYSAESGEKNLLLVEL
jgi:hypothetical protein